jgi:uncharacterized membrane protein (GlpM family)
MNYLLIKAAITGVLVVAISEVSKKSTSFAGVIASLPLTSVLAFLWIYLEKKEIEGIRSLSYSIFFMVIPSLAFFLLLPTFLKWQIPFYASMVLASIGTALIYAGYVMILSRMGIQF